MRQRKVAVFVILLSVAMWGVTVWRKGLLHTALDEYGAGTVLLCQDGVPLRIGLGEDDQDVRPADFQEMSPWVMQALVAAEDKRFYQHAGIDPVALIRAVGQNLWHRERISGASTLSTQVIRMAEPRSRTLDTKVIEAAKAFYMEFRYDKEDVLAQYLNRAPFGGNIRGIEAASRIYFDKSAVDLTLAESALLAGVPQSPSRLRPDRNLAKARVRMEYVLSRMLANEMITQQQHDAALQQPLSIQRHPRPFLAPHFSELVLQRTKEKRGEIYTTLDRDIQQRVEQTLHQHIAGLQNKGIHNGAVVVLDVASGNVLAMVGSFDYQDQHHAGMFNHALALRSPGSALKPFLYAMALDQGMSTPGTILRDDPVHTIDGTPQNFDQRYRGDVSVRDALIQSLNIPAIRILQMVGEQKSLDTLRRLGLDTIDGSAGDYGYTLAIGGCEVTLLDLVNAYACLARGGKYTPYRLVQDEGQSDSFHIFSPETTFMISDILGGEERSIDMFGHVADARLPRFAWKTGTSSGFRDAWTIAWNPQYVIGVWLGNSDGTGSRSIVGAEVAAPLVGDLARTLVSQELGFTWFARPAGLARREGQDGNQEWYIPGISAPIKQPEESVAPLRITTPVDGATYQLLPGDHLEQTLAIEPEGHEGVLHWFINGAFVGKTAGEAPLHWPLQQGEHTFVCVADSGVSAKTRITVQR